MPSLNEDFSPFLHILGSATDLKTNQVLSIVNYHIYVLYDLEYNTIIIFLAKNE